MNTRFLSLIAAGLAGATIAAATPAQAQALPTDYNYVGVGVGIGSLGTSSIGLGVNSKITVADHISVRPTVISDLTFNSNGETLIMAPVTYDFNPLTANGKLMPFVGGGVSVSTQGSGAVGPVVTAGVDYRVTDRLTLNGGVHMSIFGNTQVNGLVGVGYNF